MGVSDCSVMIWALVSYDPNNYALNWRKFKLNLEILAKELRHLFLMHVEKTQIEADHALTRILWRR